MNKAFSIIFCFLLFTSCNGGKDILFATMESGGNIKVGSPVLMNDFKVGAVEEMDVDDQLRIRVKMKFTSPNKFPTDSKFELGSKDLFRDAIVITPGSSSKHLTRKDEIVIEKRKVINDLENMVDWMSDRIESSEIKGAADSLVKELNKLSETIENLGDFDIQINREEKE